MIRVLQIVLAGFVISLAGFFIFQFFSTMPSSLDHQVQMEVASTPAQWERGLVGHPPLDDEHGMLFDFGSSEEKRCMWNKDVAYSVDVGFYDERWKLLGGVTMQPYEMKVACSPIPVRYVVEMRGGWFRDHSAKGK